MLSVIVLILNYAFTGPLLPLLIELHLGCFELMLISLGKLLLHITSELFVERCQVMIVNIGKIIKTV